MAKLLVRTTDCRICPNWERRECAEGQAASSPSSQSHRPPHLGTYQLVVIDHNQLHILGLTVYCRVAPADLGRGWAHGISSLHVWSSRRQTREGLGSSQEQYQLPTGGGPIQPWYEAGSLGLPRAGMCVDISLRELVGGFLPGMFSDLQPHQSEPSSAPATDEGVLSGPLPEVSAVGGLYGPPYLPFPSQPRPVWRSRMVRGSKQAAWREGAGEGGTAGPLPSPAFPPLPGSLHPKGAGRRGVR